MKLIEITESIKKPINGASITKDGHIDVTSLIKRHDKLLDQDPKHLFDLMGANDELELIDYVLDTCDISNGFITSDEYRMAIAQYHQEHPRGY
jgi:hypothetical protein